MGFTPYITSLVAPLEEAIRGVLGLKPNVRVEYDNRARGLGQQMWFTLHLPNGQWLRLELRHPSVDGWVWAQAADLVLACRPRFEGQEPLRDPKDGPALEAVRKLFLRATREDPALVDGVWRAFRALGPFDGLDDTYYRRVFHGPMGSIANLRLGFRCNQDCTFCWQDRTWPEPPPELYGVWLDEMAQQGVERVSLTGGEPTLHKGLPDLIHRARTVHGMTTMVQTNAIQLSKPAVLQRMVDAAPDRLFVSFHAADAATSDAMTRAPNTHRRTVAGIKAALGAGLKVSLNCVIETANHEGLGAHAQFIVDNFVAPFPDNPVVTVTYSRAQRAHDADLWMHNLVGMDAVATQLRPAIAQLEAAGVVLDLTSGSCGLPACVIRDRPDLICLPAPNALGEAASGFEQEWRSRSACGRCALRDRCHGPGSGYIEKFGDRGLVPFDTMPEISDRFPLTV